ncbi:hypothetical protein ACQRIT_007484 [Beauveria bassiana]
MQLRVILASLLVGIAAAMPQNFVFPDDEGDGCDEGVAVEGPQGTVCIGSHNENYGPPKAKGPCPVVVCLRRLDCGKPYFGPDGCEICPPGC